MKTTGYQLQLRIKNLKRDVEAYSTMFENGKTKFEGEDKMIASEAYTKFRQAEDDLALTQSAQAVYNAAVKVTVQGKEMSLARAIKLLGGAGRGEAMWRSIVAPKKDRYMREESSSKDNDKVYATPTYTMKQAMEEALKASKLAEALRQAIQEANAKEVEILDSLL